MRETIKLEERLQYEKAQPQNLTVDFKFAMRSELHDFGTHPRWPYNP